MALRVFALPASACSLSLSLSTSYRSDLVARPYSASTPKPSIPLRKMSTSESASTSASSKATTRRFGLDEVRQHADEGNLWIVVNDDVYDLSKFADMHPGGSAILYQKGVAGADASEAFFALHRSEVLVKYARLKIGSLDKAGSAPPPYHIPQTGELSKVPYAEPMWLAPEYASPYFKQSHRDLQKAVRVFFDGVKPEAREREVTGERPSKELIEKMGEDGINIHAMRMGPGEHLKGRRLLGGVEPSEFDYFHEMVVVQELVRVGAPGFMAGMQAGMVIGLPPVLHYGSDKMKAEVLPDILAGKKFISLAISEAAAGSDVQGMTTVAKKTADGKYFEVTGNKKCRDHERYILAILHDWSAIGRERRLSMLLIPRTDEVETKPIKTSYSAAAGTAFVTFDKTLVPVENLLGKEGEGVKVILGNFNHERIVICWRIIRYSRLIYEECMKYAHLRKVFGKPLVELPVIRAKLADMVAKIEAGQAWTESLTFQMTQLTPHQISRDLGGPVASLKYFLSKTAGEISQDAVQIFGGRGITQGGMGVLVDQFQRSYKFDSILGGSEEVLADLSVRQASKKMPKVAL